MHGYESRTMGYTYVHASTHAVLCVDRGWSEDTQHSAVGAQWQYRPVVTLRTSSETLAFFGVGAGGMTGVLDGLTICIMDCYCAWLPFMGSGTRIRAATYVCMQHLLSGRNSNSSI